MSPAASLRGGVAVTSAVSDHLLRRSGHIVQDCLLRSLCWADIPRLSAWDASCPAAWQQCWQQSRPGAHPRPSAFQAGHMPSWRGSCECYALSPVGGAGRWLLLLLSPLLSGAVGKAGARRLRAGHLAARAVVLVPPLSPIGLTVADPFAGGEVSRADSRDAMKERASAPGGCWKLQSIRLHQGTGGPR
jgi:hypothetical protein